MTGPAQTGDADGGARAPCVVVVGSSNTDLVVQCPELPQPGETVLGGRFGRFAGGKGANQAVAAARAGVRVAFVGARGADDFGEAACAGLERDGIDTRFLAVKPDLPSGVALILIGGADRQNLIAVADSANGALTAADVAAAEPAFVGCGAVLAQLEIPLEAVEAAAELAARNGAAFVLNPAPCRELPDALLRQTHTLTPNEHEAALLTGVDGVEAAADRLLARGCRQVAVTLGERGVFLRTAEQSAYIPAPRVEPVDTVGAGDCFTGWLAAGIAEGLNAQHGVERAVAAAAVAVTREGAQAGMPLRREIVDTPGGQAPA